MGWYAERLVALWRIDFSATGLPGNPAHYLEGRGGSSSWLRRGIAQVILWLVRI